MAWVHWLTYRSSNPQHCTSNRPIDNSKQTKWSQNSGTFRFEMVLNQAEWAVYGREVNLAMAKPAGLVGGTGYTICDVSHAGFALTDTFLDA